MLGMTSLSLGPDNELLCPFCRSEYTHFATVRIGARREDDPVYLVSVEADTAQIEGSYYESDQQPPSSRRSWVELAVDCESCIGGSIVIAQHKGKSYVTSHPSQPSVAPAGPAF
jgi:hypothetical protein